MPTSVAQANVVLRDLSDRLHEAVSRLRGHNPILLAGPHAGSVSSDRVGCGGSPFLAVRRSTSVRRPHPRGRSGDRGMKIVSERQVIDLVDLG